MNYYRRNLGDYARDTKHLSMLEHGAYNLLLDALYATETPLPESRKMLFRLCSAVTTRQQNAVISVLDQFFFLKPTGFSNKRFEKELKHVKSRGKVAQENGKKGGRPRKQKANVKLNESKPETHEKATPDSRLQTPELSQDHLAVVGVTDEKPTAAAFVAIGFDKPFGNLKFQAIWLKHYEKSVAAKEWLNLGMEAAIQECQSLGIGVPPQFFEQKREVEKWDKAEFDRKYHRTPL